MAEIYEYDEVAATQNRASRIHAGWNTIREHSSSGQKAWLTQMKNGYMRLVQADPEAAAEMLAINEYEPNESKENESSAIGAAN